MSVQIINGDCRAALEYMPSNSVDSVVTDPPYALLSISKRFANSPRSEATENSENPYGRTGRGFMGKRWDNGSTAFDPAFWADVRRVLKPGGHVLAFGGTRTYHRLACAIEDGGFEIRDQIGWLYGSGFPKSHNQIGQWQGWGTALKPAWEPIVVARKALDGTNAQNLTKWGVGALNIDGCRVGDEIRYAAYTSLKPAHGNRLGAHGTAELRRGTQGEPVRYEGRWPANVIHDGSNDVLAAFPQAPGQQRASRDDQRTQGQVYGKITNNGNRIHVPRDNGGSAARFFYCAKASKKDRGESNTHPTVKPTDLMRYLCRLVTPPGGVVLDPFMGSGSTGRGALLEGFRFIGVELEAEYAAIARARIAAVQGVFA